MLGPSVAICVDCVGLARGLLEGRDGDVRAPAKVRECPFCERVLSLLVHEACKEELLRLLLETPHRRREELFDVHLRPDFDAHVERLLAPRSFTHDETSASTHADLARAYAEMGMGEDVLAAVVCALSLHDAYATAYGTAVEALAVLLERRGLDVRERFAALIRGS